MIRTSLFVVVCACFVVAAGASAEAAPSPAGEAAPSRLPAFLKNVDLSGSVRTRYEWISNENPTPPDPKDQNRFRYRVLFGAVWHPEEEIEAGLRLGTAGTSGAQAAATSQHTTFDDAFRDDPLYIDLAYVTWTPKYDIARTLGFSMTLGKHKNPMRSRRFLWDVNISPEGGYVVLAPRAFERVHLSFVEAAWILEEENQGALGGFTKGADAYVLAHQLRGGLDDMAGLDLSGYASLYHFVRPSLISRDAANFGFGNNTTAGNRLNSEFSVVTVGGEARGRFGSIPFALGGEWSKNDAARPNPASGRVEDNAWSVFLELGKVRGRGDWAAALQYAEVESDAQVAAFVDGSLGSGLGNTNFRTFRPSLKYGLTDHATLGLIYYHTKEENGLRNDPDQDLLQVDFEVKW